jgi:hypothetical protein
VAMWLLRASRAASILFSATSFFRLSDVFIMYHQGLGKRLWRVGMETNVAKQ